MVNPTTCNKCNKEPVPYVELDHCLRCAGATVVDPQKAAAWAAQKATTLETTLKELMDARPRGFGQGVVEVVEAEGLQRVNGGFAPEYRTWILMDAYGRRLAPATKADETDPQGHLRKFADAALALADIRSLAFTLPQREYDLLEGVSPKSNPKIRGWPFSPPWAATRRDHWWTQWTSVHFGEGPDLATNEPAFYKKVVNGQDDATILLRAFRLLPKEEARSLPLYGHRTRMLLKRFVPHVLERIEKIPVADLEGVDILCQGLVENAEDPASRVFESGKGPSVVDAARLKDYLDGSEAASALAPFTCGQGDPVFPFLVPVKAGWMYSPQMAKDVGLLITGCRKLSTREKLGKLTAKAYEHLAALTLKGQGYEVEANGTLCTGLSLTAKAEDDVDVLAWTKQEVLMVEVKSEAERPGAWTVDMVQKRRDWLSKEWAKLEGKVKEWRARLQKPPVHVFRGESPVDLPATLGKLPIRRVIISARIEPRLPGGHEVCTLVTPASAEVIRRRVELGDKAPLWDGAERIPAGPAA